MGKKGLIFLLVLAVVIAGAIGGTIIFLSRLNAEDIEGQTARGSILTNLSDVQSNPIIYMRLKDDQSAIELELREKGIWTSANNQTPIDQDAVKSILSSLTFVDVSKMMDIGEANLSAYGLDPGDLVVTYMTSAGVYTYYYGQYAMGKNAVYFRKQGDDTVYTIKAYCFDDIKNALVALRE
ncbi:MAG: DUF4340 domain-containing protein [Christensenellales bacterium]